MALVEAEDRIVEKEELLKTIWPDSFVEEGSLARNVSVLRKVLGKGSEDQSYIQTIPKRGYRLAVPIQVVHPVPETMAPPVAPGLTAAQTSLRGVTVAAEPVVHSRAGAGVLRKRAIVILVLLAAVGTAWWLAKHRSHTEKRSVTTGPVRSIAFRSAHVNFTGLAAKQCRNWLKVGYACGL